jgi:LysR family glycine cleavage system transcriptional activator
MKIGKKWISLNSLHTFEAMGRHLNMANAAAELSVTQSAVSHQIKALEGNLNVKLFAREGRKLALTMDGQNLLQSVQRALQGITATCIQLGDDVFSGKLSIAAPASFSTQWLMPRLSSFLTAFPNLTLRHEVIPSKLQTQSPDADVAIVFNEPRFPGKRATILFDLEMFPVCAPALLGNAQQLDASALRTQTLIHEDDGELWARWFAATGTEQFQPHRHIHAGTSHDATELARTGLGFAINDKFTGATGLAKGELIRPFANATMAYGHYYLLTPTLDQMSEPASEFERWIKREAG